MHSLMWDDELKADGARTPIGPHSPGPILYMCGSEYVGETTLRHPDTTYRHTLPNRFYTYVIASMWARRRCNTRTPLTATPSPTDSLGACGTSLIPRTRSRARLRRAHEARATAEWVARWPGSRVAG